MALINRCMSAETSSTHLALSASVANDEGASPISNDDSTVPELFTWSTCVILWRLSPDPSETEPRLTIKAIPPCLTP